MKAENSHIYVCQGDILSTNADAVRPGLFAVCEGLTAGALVQFDLRAARMIDSVGLNLIVSALRRAKAQDAQVRIRVSHPTVERMMTFTRIDQHAEVVNH
ncbi:MAG: STAS domain-containing protein [Opitutales bacterium]